MQADCRFGIGVGFNAAEDGVLGILALCAARAAGIPDRHTRLGVVMGHLNLGDPQADTFGQGGASEGGKGKGKGGDLHFGSPIRGFR
jgi:hypothetical protein